VTTCPRDADANATMLRAFSARNIPVCFSPS
jgi:hypothetical protein